MFSSVWRFSLVVLLFLLGLLLSAVSVAWLALEDSPRITINGTQQLNNADHVDALMKQVQNSIFNRESPSTLSITEDQLDSLKGLVQRASFDMSGDATLAEGVGKLQGSFGFQMLGAKKFINAEIWVNEGLGLQLEKVNVGRVTLPGWLAKSLGEWGINFYTGSRTGSKLLNTVKSISISTQSVDVALHPLEPLLEELRRIEPGEVSPRDAMIEAYTKTFLRTLENYEKKNGYRARSLTDYINVVFVEAAALNNIDDVVIINEAAILSLAVYTGHSRIGTLIGDVQLDIDNPSAPNHSPTLAGREDLSKHFIISAALEILSKRALSLAIGEFKELMDRAKGGSGYSFVDLAADRAGVRFAVEVTNPQKADLLQQRISTGMTEAAYFPSIAGLVEGLDKQAFTDRYGEVDSLAYQTEVNEIKARIARLPLYADF